MEHPGDIAEANGLALVPLPEPTFPLEDSIPIDIIANRKLSILQLEGVQYACQRHQHFLPDGTRAGFFLGDGAGVGKGRQSECIPFTATPSSETLPNAWFVRRRAIGNGLNLMTFARSFWNHPEFLGSGPEAARVDEHVERSAVRCREGPERLGCSHKGHRWLPRALLRGIKGFWSVKGFQGRRALLYIQYVPKRADFCPTLLAAETLEADTLTLSLVVLCVVCRHAHWSR